MHDLVDHILSFSLALAYVIYEDVCTLISYLVVVGKDSLVGSEVMVAL